MINYKEFEAKIRTMSAYDIIMAMVEGLKNPRTEIDMMTFGSKVNGICYGGAATNAILHIMEANKEEVEDYVTNLPSLRSDLIDGFERAIVSLSEGKIEQYNECARLHGFAQIAPFPDQKLPYLGNYYTNWQLELYKILAERQLLSQPG